MIREIPCAVRHSKMLVRLNPDCRLQNGIGELQVGAFDQASTGMGSAIQPQLVCRHFPVWRNDPPLATRRGFPLASMGTHFQPFTRRACSIHLCISGPCASWSVVTLA